MRVLRFFTENYVLEYTYFLRIPIVIAAVMVVSPILAVTWFKNILRNFFELEFSGLFIVTWFSVFLAWSVMYTFWQIFLHVPQKTELPWRKEDKNDGIKKNTLPPSMQWQMGIFPVRLFLSMLLCLPVWCVAFLHSPASNFKSLSGIALGIGWSLLLWVIFVGFTQSQKGQEMEAAFQGNLPSLPEWGKKIKTTIITQTGSTSAEESDKDIQIFTNRRARRFFALTLAVYILGFFCLSPESSTGVAGKVPALTYILLLVILLNWILSGLTMKLDRFRVPILVIVLMWFLGIGSCSDHYYQINQDGMGKSPLTALDSYNGWKELHPPEEYETVVLVAASGGGIKAAYWTALALTNLQKELDKFSQSILLISATSGGGVGSMYYVDKYRKDEPPRNEDIQLVLDAASASSLGAVGWGIAYPDFWKLLTPASNWFYKHQDRGWAQEKQWAKNLEDPERTLGHWKKGVRAGWRPTLVFNATIGETGEIFLLSPTHLGQPPPLKDCNYQIQSRKSGIKAFQDIYPGYDMRIVTSARLSATFPYVTPMARPDIPDDCIGAKYHIADGGYYDNYGVVAIIHYLRQILTNSTHKRFMFVQIRASDFKKPVGPDQTKDPAYEATGPVKTLLNVRTSSQILRNDMEIQLLVDYWKNKKDILPVVFELDTGPLSWDLSETEKEKIERTWTNGRNRNSLGLAKSFFYDGIGICPIRQTLG